MSAVETRDVFRIYGDGSAVALQGLTMSVQPGEIVVVFGPSGSGKSTLLRILARLDMPSAGTVTVFGEDLRELRGPVPARVPLARVSATSTSTTRVALAPELTASASSSRCSPRCSGTSASSGCGARTSCSSASASPTGDDARPHELSGGEQQRVALAAAIAHRPKLLIADEPTGELDAANARNAYALIGELAREERADGDRRQPRSAVRRRSPTASLHIRDGRVSAESASERGHAEEIVLARGGWLRLPEELLRVSGIAGRASARVEDGGIVISPASGACRSAGADGSAARRGASRARSSRSCAASTKSYGARRVLDDVDGVVPRRLPHGGHRARPARARRRCFTCSPGSTRPTTATVVVLGRAPDERTAAQRDRARRAGRAPDPVPERAGERRARARAAPRRPRGRGRRARSQSGSASSSDERVSRLSTGERQRVALARAIAARPKLLLADEPTARLDEANARTIGALFARLAAETGAAIVCATHDPALIEQADARLPLDSTKRASAASDEAAGRGDRERQRRGVMSVTGAGRRLHRALNDASRGAHGRQPDREARVAGRAADLDAPPIARASSSTIASPRPVPTARLPGVARVEEEALERVRNLVGSQSRPVVLDGEHARVARRSAPFRRRARREARSRRDSRAPARDGRHRRSRERRPSASSTSSIVERTRVRLVPVMALHRDLARGRRLRGGR